MFFSFSFTSVGKRFFFNVEGFLDPSLDCGKFVCSISRVVSWCMLKKVTKHASLLYLCSFDKAGETFSTGSDL